jgi:hypothetical protein
MRRAALVIVLVLVVAAGLSGQSGPPAPVQGDASAGQQFVVKMELQKTAAAPAQEGNNMFAMMGDMLKQTMLPDGTAEMTTTTDGRSVRTELRGRLLTMPSGSIMLAREGAPGGGYVLNPADKTYYAVKLDDVKMPELPGGMTMPKPEFSVKSSGTFEVIAGHRAERVDVSWRIAVPVPEGIELPPGFPTEVSLDLEQWCAPDIKLPAAGAVQSIGAIGKMLPGMGLDEILKACSFPLRSRMRMSVIPGYEMLTSVTSITAVPTPPEMFAIPPGYKEVPMPTPKLPGIGG